MLIFLLVMLFILGTIVGSLLNVCIYRLPMEKSILWPGSHCGHCWQPIRWYDNIPLVSYLLLRGRCRTCKSRYSPRYFFIELFTGLCFSGLFYLEVVADIHGLFPKNQQANLIERLSFPTWSAWGGFGFHALLLCFLIVATFTDLDHREIPLTITIPGTVLGLVGALLWAWPWPQAPVSLPANWWQAGANPRLPTGLYPWPFWAPLPAWFAPGNNWQTGLATGLAGALAGSVMLRAIRFLFGLGLGIEALGLGDADLMMMAGSFLGWQPVVVAFFVGVFAGLAFGIAQLVVRGDNMLPFGPGLAVGVVTTFLCWSWIAPHVMDFFFNGPVVLFLAIVSSVLMLGASYLLRLTKLMRR
jgi:leader peptidase (prepilin peptidase)/N-methyltransferase